MEVGNKPSVESSFLTRDQALSLWSGSTESKTLDYQRTNPAATAATCASSAKTRRFHTQLNKWPVTP